MTQPFTGPFYGLHESLPPDDDRQATWLDQRSTRGFDDTELWNLDTTIAKFILPRLQAYKLASDHEDDKGIDKMIAAFQMIVEGIHFTDFPREMEEGLNLFQQNYFRLWI